MQNNLMLNGLTLKRGIQLFNNNEYRKAMIMLFDPNI